MVALGQLGRGGPGPVNQRRTGSVQKACDDELQRRCYVEQGNLTECRKVFSEMLTPALKMLAPPAHVVARQAAARSSTRRLCAAVGQFSEMQIAVSTRQQSFLPRSLWTSSGSRPQQRTRATSLEAVLLELGLKAKKGTKSSDYAGHQAVPGTVVLLERGIIFRWHPPSKD